MRADVERVLDELIRPLVEADGGDVALQSLDASRAPVEITLLVGGAYRGCPGTPVVVDELIAPVLERALGFEVRVRVVPRLEPG